MDQCASKDLAVYSGKHLLITAKGEIKTKHTHTSHVTVFIPAMDDDNSTEPTFVARISQSFSSAGKGLTGINFLKQLI